MSRLSSAMAIALVGVAVAASVSLGQQSLRRRSSGSEPEDAATIDPMASARGARLLLRNGKDYLEYQEYERALAFFREAESRKGELTSAELKALRDGIARAQRGLQEVGNSPRRAYAKSRNSAPGTVVAARSRDHGSPREEDATEDDPVQLAGATASVPPASAPAPGRPRRRPARPQNMPDEAPAIPATLPQEVAVAPTPAPRPAPAALEPASAPPAELTTNPAEPAAASVPSAELAATPPPADPVPLPAPRQAPSTSALSSLPPLPGEAPQPGTPPEPLPEPSPAPISLKPDTTSTPPPATTTSDGLPPLPAEPDPAATEPPVAEPAPELPVPTATRHSAGLGSEPSNEPAAAPVPVMAAPRSSLSPELRREVERIAQMQEEAAQRNQANQATSSLPPGLMNEDQPMTRLELPRAPSPTEARPLRAIPVPEEFVPLAPRQWGPTRKYWAAAATCHAPLYFQDAMLERYGHSAEQFFGRGGRFLTYPLDDPTQSNQRNQIIQPFFSAGLFALQIAMLPYNAIMDAPWEAEYDLGYWRPGDRIPPDLIYVPPTGVGPPLRGANY